MWKKIKVEGRELEAARNTRSVADQRKKEKEKGSLEKQEKISGR